MSDRFVTITTPDVCLSSRPRSAGVEPAVVYPNGNKVFYLAQGVDTSGTFGLYRWEFAGPPSGPESHFHKTIAESFYVLMGTVRIFDGNAWIDAGPGDFVNVPRGTVHNFRNAGSETARMVLTFTPAGMERFFERSAELPEDTARALERPEILLALRCSNRGVGLALLAFGGAGKWIGDGDCQRAILEFQGNCVLFQTVTRSVLPSSDCGCLRNFGGIACRTKNLRQRFDELVHVLCSCARRLKHANSAAASYESSSRETGAGIR